MTDPAALDAAFEQAITDGCEGLMCKSVGPASVYQAGNRGWLWIKLKRDYRTELSDTVDLVIVGAFAGRGQQAGTYGAVLLAAYDPDAELYRTVTKCGTGFSDADLAALPGRLAPLACAEQPARVDARQQPGLLVRAGGGDRGPSRRADPVAALLGGLGADQGGRRAGHAVPAVHRALAGRQGPGGRHHHRRAGRPVPHRAAGAGQLVSAADMGSILVGTASWTDKTLIASGWYPPEANTPEKRLRFYARQFPLVEVDATYYALPAEQTAASWAERTPAGFTFNVKAFSLFTQHPTPVKALPADLREAVASSGADPVKATASRTGRRLDRGGVLG